MINKLKKSLSREILIKYFVARASCADAIIHSWEMSAINRLAVVYLTAWLRLLLDHRTNRRVRNGASKEISLLLIEFMVSRVTRVTLNGLLINSIYASISHFIEQLQIKTIQRLQSDSTSSWLRTIFHRLNDNLSSRLILLCLWSIFLI